MPPFRPAHHRPGPWRWRLRRWLRSAAAVAVLVGAMWLLWGSPFGAEQLRPSSGSVRVIDGDSFTMRSTDGRVTLRLTGIDAPEYRQSCMRADGSAWPCGTEAAAALATLLREPGLSCEVEAEDRFGRTLGRCSTARTPDIGAAMVAKGLAIANGRGDLPPYWLDQQRAEAARRGLWQGEFERPTDWRRAHPRQGD